MMPFAAEIERFGRIGREWEWKHYSYDRPDDLPARLLAADFVAEPTEALLVAEIADLDLDPKPPAGIELRPVTGADDAAALVAVGNTVFGGDRADIGRQVLAGLEQSPTTVEAVIAWAGVTPVSAARAEFHAGTDFAGLWGAERCRPGVAGACSAHSSPTGQRWRPPADSVTCKSMRFRPAGRSSNGSASSSSPSPGRSSIPAQAGDHRLECDRHVLSV